MANNVVWVFAFTGRWYAMVSRIGTLHDSKLFMDLWMSSGWRHLLWWHTVQQLRLRNHDFEAGIYTS